MPFPAVAWSSRTERARPWLLAAATLATCLPAGVGGWLVLIGRSAPAADAAWPGVLLAGGLLASVLVATLVGRLAHVQQRSHRAALALRRRAQSQLKRLDALFDNMAEGVVVTDDAGRILRMNRAAERMFGLPLAQVRDGPFGQLLADDGRDAAVLRTLPDGSRLDLTGRRADGSAFPMALSLGVCRVDDTTQRVAVLRDQSESAAAAASLAESARALQAADALRRAVFQHAALALIVSDAQGVIRAMNPAAERLLACQAPLEVGRSTLSSLHDRNELETLSGMLRQHLTAARESQAVGGLVQGQGIERAMHYLRRDGSRVPVSVTISALHGDDGQVTGFLSIACDITERMQLAERLSHLAYYDSLTGLPNRVMLEQRLQAALDHARQTRRPLALLFIDLDRFKPINDQHGHAVGDLVLCEVAQRLKATLRQEDLVARLGGDEFVVVLTTLARLDDASIVADKLLGSLTQPMAIGGLALQVGASIGVARYPAAGTDVATLLRAADVAMYEAKHAGRDTLQRISQPWAG